MRLTFLAVVLPAVVYACHRAPAEAPAEMEGATPVTVTHPTIGRISEEVSLNATASFQIKIPVKSDINGYLSQVAVTPGQQVQKGQVLFMIKTREAAHLGTLSSLDTSLRFSGLVKIMAPVNGFVNELSVAAGDYVQEGETLVTVSDQNSLVFLLELPYELKPNMPANKTLLLTLPDGKQLEGAPDRLLPVVNPASQTQTCVIKVHHSGTIPENLVASVRFIKNSKNNVVLLPREALLTNEVQDEYWIMKMIDSITAVKVIVDKGIESPDQVEVTGTGLTPGDIVLLSGNYGLPDTARVIIKQEE
jgi:multidrug efflux pump subunit AcrA (membrane-fusion protein)